MRPWHFGQVSASVMNTRCSRSAQGSRLPLCILVISISRDSPSPVLSAPAESAHAASGAGGAAGVGTTLARSLAAGLRMPWYRTRWQRGRGINRISFSISSCGVNTIGGWRLETGDWRSRPNTRDHQPQARSFNAEVPAIERSAPLRFRRPFLTAHDRHRRKGSQDDPQARVGTRPRVRNRAQCREIASSQPQSAERILLRCSTPWKQPLAGLATSIRISLRAGRSDYVGRPPRQGYRPTRTPEACCDRAFAISSSPYSLGPPASSLSAVSFDKAKSFRDNGARTHSR